MRVISHCVWSKSRCGLYLVSRKINDIFMWPLWQAAILCQSNIKHYIQSILVISTPDNSILPLNSEWHFSPHICPHLVQNHKQLRWHQLKPIQAESQEDRFFRAEAQQVILNRANKKSKTTKNRRKMKIRMNHCRNCLWICLLPNVVAQLPKLTK